MCYESLSDFPQIPGCEIQQTPPIQGLQLHPGLTTPLTTPFLDGADTWMSQEG